MRFSMQLLILLLFIVMYVVSLAVQHLQQYGVSVLYDDPIKMCDSL